MCDVELERKIVTFVSEWTGRREREITRQTRLLHDLDITGDDANEILDAFSKKFKVKIDKFNYIDFFPEEGQVSIPDFLVTIFSIPRSDPKERLQSYFPLTINDLIEAAHFGILRPFEFKDGAVQHR